ncbi:MAG TPA: RNA polymerase sigma factor [Chloroflexia bacterium]|nr:RNA polymerase sigma factor [Chloroflexia bacterium]
MREGTLTLAQAAAPDETFDMVFSVHHDYVYHLARALLGHPQDAEDVTQEVFLRVYKALPSYTAERGTLRTWLTRIVVNSCQTHRRRSVLRRLWQRPPTAGDQDAVQDLADSSAWGAPESQALQAELRQTVKTLLARLGLEHRTVLVLHYYLDFSCPEIARILDCSEGTVYSRLHYARRRVQSQLASQPGTPVER